MDFWLTSGFHLLDRDENGWLQVTRDYMCAYWRRPEVAPVEESCDAERAVHARMVGDPTGPLADDELRTFEDQDTADNFRMLHGFLCDLETAGSLEAYYLKLFQSGRVAIPPLFIDQMGHAIARNFMADVTNPLQLRAAELLFRDQRATIEDGAIMLADADTVNMYAETGGFGSLGKLLVDGNAALRSITLDVLNEDNAAIYWDRSDQFDTVIDITFPRPGLDALCRVLERWITHFLKIETRVHPVQSIRDEKWRWHVGLDTVSTAILNDLYGGKDVPEEQIESILSLFRLEFKDQDAVQTDMKGKPIYLALAKDGNDDVKMKPQNLLVNLPLKTFS